MTTALITGATSGIGRATAEKAGAARIATYGRGSLLLVWMRRFRRQNLASATSGG
jgi:NAD(P)-dependent dehydrogenase (short-subunit alcohol dehydrogenase family)